MQKRHVGRAALGLAVAGSLALTGCSAADPADEATPDAQNPVELVIGNRPAATEEAQRAYFDAEVEAFEAAHPEIAVTTTEDGWDAQTFAARLAAGDLPTVFGVPFTEMSGLIERGQVADLTDAVTASGVADELNPSLVDLVTGADDAVYGVPTSAYAMGLVYNRALFTQAGLDPDDPPQTWDEVREAAATITEQTGQAGLARITTDNQGGWVLAAEIASRGGSLVDAAGTTVTFDDTPAQDALELLHAMRWEDGSLSENALMGATDAAQAFAAGQAAMFVIQSEAFQPITQLLQFPAEDFGFTAMPTVDEGDTPVTLSGGNIDIVRPDATAAQVEAAVQWIEFHQLARYTDEDAARAAAQAAVDEGTPVAIPGIPVIDAAAYDEYLGWIEDLNNVPVENFRPYLDRSVDQVVQAEPPTGAQDIYAALDPVVQAVISDQAADIPTLLGDAASAAQTTLGR